MLRIYTPISLSTFGAQAFYRQSQPLHALQQIDRASVYFDFGEVGQSNTRGAAQDVSSIHFLHQHTTPAMQAAIERYTSRPAHWVEPPSESADGEWDASPSIVLDTDDDFFNAMPWHKGTFRRYGTKDADGNPLEPGQGIAEQDGDAVRVLWEDGKDDFNIARNQQTMAQWRTNLALAALVTVSTPHMERVVKREVPNANTFVLPNCINFDDYPEHPGFVDDGKIRILWQGGHGHEMCLREVLPILKELHDEYPQVEFLFWGGPPEDVSNAMTSPRWRTLPWRSYFEYKLRLNQLGHDINICPLFKHPFNEARSAIKWYESSACSKPAATLAANYAAFANEIVDGETGLLYNDTTEFRAKLIQLIEDAALRKRLAESAKAWLREHRDPKVWAAKLADKLDEIRAYKRNFTKPPLAPAKEIVDVPAEHPDLR